MRVAWWCLWPSPRWHGYYMYGYLHLCWHVESFVMCPGTLLGYRVYFGVIWMKILPVTFCWLGTNLESSGKRGLISSVLSTRVLVGQSAGRFLDYCLKRGRPSPLWHVTSGGHECSERKAVSCLPMDAVCWAAASEFLVEFLPLIPLVMDCNMEAEGEITLSFPSCFWTWCLSQQ